ncbi:MAG TPA: nucleotide disphospho-sugar-binding domain-containing protein [Solirubrobacteraceae bacterium]
MKVLAYTSPARGHVYPLVPIMQALARRGHDVHAITFSPELGALAAAGVEASPMDVEVERIQIEDWRARSQRAAVLAVLRAFLARAAGEVHDLRAGIERHDPDVLLVDVNCWGAAVVAEASERPWAMYSPYLLPLRSRDAPPFGPGLEPASGPLGHLRDALMRAVGNVVLGRVVLPGVNRLRAEHGLAPLHRFEDALARPPLLLALTAEGFDYPRRDWPANVRLVGPVDFSPPAPAPAWLDELADPLVLVTCSTEHQDDAALVTAALEALPPAGLGVLATSAAHDAAGFSAPAGSRVERFVSHEAVLERAACVVCHGGMGIVQKALGAGVPVVVVPYGRDQMETARRVTHARAGAHLSPKRLTGQRLLAAVEKARTRRAGAAHVAELFAAAGGAQAAAEAVEALARTA